MTVLPLILNIALLVTLSVVQQFIIRRWREDTLLRRIASGVLFGIVAIIVMRTPLELAPGVIFDGRSIILSIAGLFGGPLVAVIASAIAATYRIYLGGAGATMGILVIAESALLGTVFGYFAKQRPKLMRMLPLWTLGLVVHVIMILLIGLLPGGLVETAVRQIALPVLALYPVGFLLVAQTMIDQRERLQNEEALTQSEERYRAIVHSAPFGIYLYRIEGDRLVFITANPAADAMIGMPHTQLQGKRIEDAFPMLGVDGVPDIFRRIAAEGGSWHVDAYEYDDGSVSGVFEVTAFNAGAGVVAVEFSEVSERIRTAEELRRYRMHLEDLVTERTRALEVTNEQLREASEAKSRFLRAMSHELRTPLNSIIGFSDILRRGLAGELAAEQRRQTEMINASGRHLLALINDVLDLVRIEAQRIEIRLEPFDANELAASVLESLRPEAEAKGLELVLDAPQAATDIVSDRLKVRQVLYNLLGNAVKFTDAGTVTLSLTGDTTLVSFAVADTGPGIATDRQVSIFEEFVQAEEDDSPREGTGLGLAISQGLAVAMGGIVRLESTPGKGSTFTLILPRTPDLGGGPRPEE